jgi:hypothetical protein
MGRAIPTPHCGERQPCKERFRSATANQDQFNQEGHSMESKQKLFAFKLAAKENASKKEKETGLKDRKWKAREGVAVAACSGPLWITFRLGDSDGGGWC